MKKSPILLLIFVGLLLLASEKPAYADSIGLLMRGVARTVFSVFQVPKEILAGSTHYFPFGLITGAVSGTMKATAGTILGATDIARGAAPYAKYLVFL